MLSNIELERLSESDVGRRLVDASGLTGWVRIEPRPVRRVVVDFSVRSDEAGRQRDVRVGTWPDRTLAEIRQNADRVRTSEETAPPPMIAAARALAQAPASSVASVPARAVPMMPGQRPRTGADRGDAGALGAGPLFEAPPSVRTITPISVAEVFERWRSAALTGRKDGGESVRRSMHKDVLPTLGATPANVVRRGQVVAVLGLGHLATRLAPLSR